MRHLSADSSHLRALVLLEHYFDRKCSLLSNSSRTITPLWQHLFASQSVLVVAYFRSKLLLITSKGGRLGDILLHLPRRASGLYLVSNFILHLY